MSIILETPKERKENAIYERLFCDLSHTLEVCYLCWVLKVTDGITNVIVFHIYWIQRMESR